MERDQMRTLRHRHYQTNAVAGSSELSRLLTAAVVSEEFCDLLLRDPAFAIAAGYEGESFHLTDEEEARILKIQARSLQEFAQQLVSQDTQYENHVNVGVSRFSDTQMNRASSV